MYAGIGATEFGEAIDLGNNYDTDIEPLIMGEEVKDEELLDNTKTKHLLADY